MRLVIDAGLCRRCFVREAALRGGGDEHCAYGYHGQDEQVEPGSLAIGKELWHELLARAHIEGTVEDSKCSPQRALAYG